MITKNHQTIDSNIKKDYWMWYIKLLNENY